MATKKVTPAAAKTTAKKATAKPAAAATKATKTTTAKPAITEEDIRKKAQEIYNARIASGEASTPESDWMNTEKALKAGRKK